MTLLIATCTEAHARQVGARLRTLDRVEAKAMCAENGPDAVAICLARSTEAFACLEDGKAIACWGYTADDMLVADKAVVWCMTTPAVERHKRKILLFSKRFVNRVAHQFGILEAYVLQEYTASLRWLHWLGFRIDEPWCVGEHDFYIVRKIRGD